MRLTFSVLMFLGAVCVGSAGAEDATTGSTADATAASSTPATAAVVAEKPEILVAAQRFAWAADPATMPAGGMMVSADLTDLPTDGLLYTRVVVPAATDEVLAYPLWVPGTHAPTGPVENLGGVFMHDDAGRTVAWERDAHDPWKFIAHPVADAKRVIVDLTYIADQPSTNSLGVDVQTGKNYALMAWNCGVVYPLGIPSTRLPCAAELRVPAGWEAATRSRETAHEGDVRRYGVLTLDQLIDRPVLAGSHLQNVVLQEASGTDKVTGDGSGARRPEVDLHVAGDGLDEADVLAGMHRLPQEAVALFGAAWFERYDFLLVVGDDGLGLEHSDCSIDGTTTQGISSGDMWSRELMPHEFTHSWVGKYRRPLGMLLDDFQAVPDFEGLWVYEGLTECLGRVLAVRSGLATPESWRDTEFHELLSLAQEPGRRWRSLHDLCTCNWQLRSGSDHHSDLRRDQDYYTEGALFWIAVERKLREASRGAKGLDDFCQAFFGPQHNHAGGFTRDQVIAALNSLAPADWAAMVHRWIDATGDLDIDAVIKGSGWKLAETKIDGADDDAVSSVHDSDLRTSLGLGMDDGVVTAVDPGSVADQAGLQTGDRITAANGAKLKQDPDALVRALARAVPPQVAVLTVSRQGHWSNLQLTLPNGLMAATLVRDDSLPDAFAVLLASRVTGATAGATSAVPAGGTDATPAITLP